MSSTNSTLEAYGETPKRGAIGFFILIILGLGLGGFALMHDAPLFTNSAGDWIIWVQGYKMWGGLLAVGIVIAFIGLVGGLLRLFSGPSQPKPVKVSRRAAPAPVSPAVAFAQDDSHLNVPASDVVAARPDNRGSLKFDAQKVGGQVPGSQAPNSQTVSVGPAVVEDTHPLFAEPEVHSLEPAIFHDNASDSFLSQNPVVSAPAMASAPLPAFDSVDALADTHGLHINTSAQVIPIRPDISVPGHDPVEAALLADTSAAPRPAPQSDMSAVISSAMRFIDTAPEPAPAQTLHVAAVAEPVAIAPVVEAAPEAPAIDDATEIRQAVATALSVWPDSTRSIAADELSVRMSHLYYDKAPESARAFQLIAHGDINAGANALQSQADALVEAGKPTAAAELWRISGALAMGRDDAKAMAAYEKVSALDPSDANIHLYLARRFQMSGDTVKQPAVLARALAVISDPAIRTELLAPYADLKMKAGDAKAAGDAFEELSRLNETAAYLKPDDVAARSTYGITVARLAQAREMQGAYDQAGPLYKKAHQVFADLSAMKPDHPGLRAMAENALKDAGRFGG